MAWLEAGSHLRLAPCIRHPLKRCIITVPHPKKDLGKGLLNQLRKLAGLK